MTISTSIAAISRLLMDVSLEATVLLTVAWIAAHLLSRASAAFRHRLWSLTMISLMALPVLPLILPSWDWEILPARSKIDTVEAGESGSSASALLEESNANSESPGAAESVRENPDADSHSKAGKPVGATAQAISAPADMTAAPSLPADPFQSPTSQIPTSSFGQSLDWLRLCLVGGWLIGAIACLIGQLFGL